MTNSDKLKQRLDKLLLSPANSVHSTSMLELVIGLITEILHRFIHKIDQSEAEGSRIF